MDLFAQGLERISSRLKQLKPGPVRDIPILIGGSGEKKTLPLVGRYASIWHSSLAPEEFRRRNDIVREHAAEAGRDETLIERAVSWPGDGASADSYVSEGVTLFTTEVHPTDQGYDLSPLEGLLAWRGGLAVASSLRLGMAHVKTTGEGGPHVPFGLCIGDSGNKRFAGAASPAGARGLSSRPPAPSPRRHCLSGWAARGRSNPDPHRGTVLQVIDVAPEAPYGGRWDDDLALGRPGTGATWTAPSSTSPRLRRPGGRPAVPQAIGEAELAAGLEAIVPFCPVGRHRLLPQPMGAPLAQPRSVRRGRRPRHQHRQPHPPQPHPQPGPHPRRRQSGPVGVAGTSGQEVRSAVAEGQRNDELKCEFPQVRRCFHVASTPPAIAGPAAD